MGFALRSWLLGMFKRTSWSMGSSPRVALARVPGAVRVMVRFWGGAKLARESVNVTVNVSR